MPVARADRRSVSYAGEGIVRLCYQREHATYDNELGKQSGQMSGSCTVDELPIDESFAQIIYEVRNFVRRRASPAKLSWAAPISVVDRARRRCSARGHAHRGA